MRNAKFYKTGLRFECSECGQCCSGASSYVEVSDPEAKTIAGFLNLTEQQFLEQYIEVPKNGELLRLKSRENGDCVFLADNRCCIYPARPLQCRTYPFWPENLKSPYRWRLAARDCPGIHHGRHYSAAEIEVLLGAMKKRNLKG